MKRLLLSCCILLCAVSTLKAQEQPLISPDDSIRSLVGRLFPNSNPNLSAHMNLQFSTSGVANFIEGDLEDASFKLNRVKLEILGSFSKQFSYHFRQSFNKYSNPHSLDNLSSSIEYALVNWKMSDKFTLTAGKQDIALGGYEYYVNAIKVREYSEFNDNISCYQAGVAGRVNLACTKEWKKLKFLFCQQSIGTGSSLITRYNYDMRPHMGSWRKVRIFVVLRRVIFMRKALLLLILI